MYSGGFFHGKQSNKILPLFIVKGVPCREICKQLGEPHGNRNLKDLLSCKRSEEGSLLAASAASTLGFPKSGGKCTTDSQPLTQLLRAAASVDIQIPTKRLSKPAWSVPELGEVAIPRALHGTWKWRRKGLLQTLLKTPNPLPKLGVHQPICWDLLLRDI